MHSITKFSGMSTKFSGMRVNTT